MKISGWKLEATMQLPFTVEQFFGVFRMYNSAVWPAQVLLLLLAALAVIFIALRRPWSGVAVGDWLGSVGNSGNTGEPHLHVHAQTPGSTDAPMGSDPIPILFNGSFPVRGDRIESP